MKLLLLCSNLSKKSAKKKKNSNITGFTQDGAACFWAVTSLGDPFLYKHAYF